MKSEPNLWAWQGVWICRLYVVNTTGGRILGIFPLFSNIMHGEAKAVLVFCCLTSIHEDGPLPLILVSQLFLTLFQPLDIIISCIDPHIASSMS